MNRGMFLLSIIGAVLNINTAWSETHLHQICYTTSAYPNKGYYLVGHGMLGSTLLYSKPPTLAESDPNCDSGTSYKISQPNVAPSTSSPLYGALGMVFSCNTCKSGYVLEEFSGPFLYGALDENVQCNKIGGVTINRCTKKTGTCNSSNCVNDSGWSVYSPSVIKKVWRTCSDDNTQCVERPEYRCAKGYVGPTPSLLPEHLKWCKPCPPYVIDGKQYKTTTHSTGTTSFESCYIDVTYGVAEYDDQIGTYKFDSQCNINLGGCKSYTSACTTISGTKYEVTSGPKINSSGGSHCWCNINGKSFYAESFSNSVGCSTNCYKNACYDAIFGTLGNNYTPYVSRAELGCE